MIITKVVMKPLKSLKLLKALQGKGCIYSGYEGKMFVLTFVSNDSDGNDIMQDLGISMEKKGIPRLYLSDPYFYNNADSEV